MTDEEIVALYWRREEDAICETAKRYGTYLTKIALNVLSNVQDSEECVNDTYLRAWNSMPTHRPAVLSVYLGKITRQLSVDLFRRKHAQKRYASEYALCLEELGDTFSDGKTPEHELDAIVLRAAIQKFLWTLSPKARQVFIGRYHYFDSVRQIAGYCGISEGTVKSSLHRTRQALKVYLTKEGFEP